MVGLAQRCPWGNQDEPTYFDLAGTHDHTSLDPEPVIGVVAWKQSNEAGNVVGFGADPRDVYAIEVDMARRQRRSCRAP
jgi:hypothetical protein